jgi:hypothetical protein
MNTNDGHQLEKPRLNSNPFLRDIDNGIDIFDQTSRSITIEATVAVRADSCMISLDEGW